MSRKSINYFLNQIPGRIESSHAPWSASKFCEYIRLNHPEALRFHGSLSTETTPLLKLQKTAHRLGVASVYVKDESKRFGLNAFKGLGASFGAYRFMEETTKAKSDITFCTMTDGNHGRAVAWSARRLGVRAEVFVPSNTSPHRISAIEGEGANVSIVQGTYDETVVHVRDTAEKNGWTMICDSSWPGYTKICADIVTGYYTLFHEISQQLEQNSWEPPTHVFLQAGVGGFASAGAVWAAGLRESGHPLTLACIEPIDADALFESATQGKIAISAGKLDSIMQGLNCGEPSMISWDILKSTTNVFLALGDSWACEGVRALHSEGVIAGESGASGLGGALALQASTEALEAVGLNKDSRILCVSTEGDTDPELYKKIVSADECGSGDTCSICS